jgi:hypothetical protein
MDGELTSTTEKKTTSFFFYLIGLGSHVGMVLAASWVADGLLWWQGKPLLSFFYVYFIFCFKFLF